MQTEVKVVPVDPADEPALHAWHEARTAAHRIGRTDPTLWTYPEAKVAYQHVSRTRRLELFAAVEGDQVVGTGTLELPLLENRRLAEVDVAVRPEYCRRGVGAALYAHVEHRARTAGRTSLLSEVVLPTGTAPEDWPATRFLARRGFTLRNTEIRRQLRFPVPGDRLDRLAAKAALRASAYRLESWTGACPDAYAEQYAHLKGLLSTEAPLGDIEYEPEAWDVARLREDEDRTHAQGRTLHVTVAVAPDGTLAGHTVAVVPRHEPGRAYQWDTLVLDQHRGHRLGLALKVTNYRILQDRHPEVTRIETWNAEQNGPMVAINVELGFEIVEALQEWQCDLAA